MTPLRRLGICNMLYFLSSQFATIFINIYIFQDFHSLRVNGAYMAVMYAAWILAFTAGSKLAGRSPRANLPLSALCGSLSLALLIVRHGSRLWIDLAVGAMLGIGSGFYYVAYNLLLYAFSSSGARGQSIARLGLLTSLVAVAMPGVSGFVVDRLGFRAAFLLVVLLYLAILALCLGFPRVEVPRVRLRDAWCVPHGFGTFALAMLSTAWYFHFLPFAAGVMVYAHGSGVAGAGWLNSLYAGLTLLANMLIGYGVKSRQDAHRQRWAWAGAAAATVATALLFLPNGRSLLAFNLLVSVANPLFFNLTTAQQFDAVGRLYANPAVGFYVREWLYTMARVGLFSYVACFGLAPGSAAYDVFIAALCLAPLWTVYWNRKAARAAG
ncbi:hypothetical protein GCM10010885_07010 [Alicyclobacillus cellulosilyticus]|uniref:MFS transporter n=1 Tax=Alicyclobacillus cellulosilyticus TaxID=1003997 RepID=A0A917NH89_9BACL|nr:MFS transporter [Alicyclobacillus cellulosilyticus]GGJ00376.1 hypothetical protein GCM10010885_07010 [Alicyclobacillus cellulosilyticus]